MLIPTEKTKLKARQWAKERQADSKRRKLKNARGYIPPSPEVELERQTNSILAELATAKALEVAGYQVNYTFAVGQFSKSDLSFNYEGENRTVQVKWGNNPGGLSIPVSHMNVDFVIAVSGNCEAGFAVCGGLSPHQITGKAGLGFSTDWGNGRSMVTGCRHDTFKENDLIFSTKEGQ